MTRLLLLGATGQLGTAMARQIDDMVTPDRTQVDLAALTRREARDLIEDARPGAVINCAAWTAVDDAEDHEEEATRTNGIAVGFLAEACSDLGLPFVTFSTDYVFDGEASSPYREESPTAPVNAYGRSKLAGEIAALEYPGSLVIRTSWIQSSTHPCFIRTMVRLGRERDEIRVVSDQVGRPTFAEDLARASLGALDLGVAGLVHIANTGATTWFDLASQTIASARGQAAVVPVSTGEYPTAAKRPAYSVLDTTKMLQLGLDPLPTWQKSLEATVEAIGMAQT